MSEGQKGSVGALPGSQNKKRAAALQESEAIKQFKRESRKAMMINLSYLAVTLAAGAFAFSLFSSGRFSAMMGFFGISMVNAKTGVYADCTKRENQHIPYCQPKEARADQEWKNLRGGKALPFNLSE